MKSGKKKNSSLDLINFHIPTYQITTSKVPVAFIFAPGKQILVRKLPPNTKYFVEPNWGLFEIKPEYVQFINKTPVYFFDTKNQNPFSPPLMAELYRWAEKNQITKLTRKHILQGIRLRKQKPEAIKKQTEEDLKKMTIVIKDMQKEVVNHNAKIEQEKSQDESAVIEGDAGELAPISEMQTNYLILKQLALESYITKEDALILDEKLRNGLLSFEEMIDYLTESKLMEVSEALPHRLDLVAENYHTYEPKDAINLMLYLSKLNKGFKGLRTTKPKNWFPATYLLFGGIAVMVLLQYVTQNGGDISSTFGGFLGIP